MHLLGTTQPQFFGLKHWYADINFSAVAHPHVWLIFFNESIMPKGNILLIKSANMTYKSLTI